MEGEGRGIPVLLRQYLKLGGRLLGLSVDREFHDALDALIAVDLTRTDPALLARYMGREGGELFLRRHGIVPRRAGAEPLAAG